MPRLCITVTRCGTEPTVIVCCRQCVILPQRRKHIGNQCVHTPRYWQRASLIVEPIATPERVCVLRRVSLCTDDVYVHTYVCIQNYTSIYMYACTNIYTIMVRAMKRTWQHHMVSNVLVRALMCVYVHKPMCNRWCCHVYTRALACKHHARAVELCVCTCRCTSPHAVHIQMRAHILQTRLQTHHECYHSIHAHVICHAPRWIASRCTPRSDQKVRSPDENREHVSPSHSRFSRN